MESGYSMPSPKNTMEDEIIRKYIGGTYFEIKGAGEVIIFLHGIGATHHMFHPQVEELSKKYQTITIDLKGSGKSNIPTKGKYTKSNIKTILDIMDYMEIKQANIVGVSYGGIIAQMFAISNPGRINKMVLIDTYGNTTPQNYEEYKLLALAAFVTVVAWLPYKIKKQVCFPMKRWEIAYKEYLHIFKQLRPKEVTKQLLEVFRIDLLSELKRLNIPSLILVGDHIEGIVKKSEELSNHLPNSRFEVLENAFDPSNLCQPQKVNEYISEFLDIHSLDKKASD